MPERLINEFDRLIRRDPAQRGLIMHEASLGPLCAGHLQAAAAHLARDALHVGLVTGFYVPHGQPPAAETDGPPGTLLLAEALQAIGVEVTVLTDEHCANAVRAAAIASGFPAEHIVVYSERAPGGDAFAAARTAERLRLSAPSAQRRAHRVEGALNRKRLEGALNRKGRGDESQEWVGEFFATGRGRTISHLVAVERVGPSHTRESLLRQTRRTPPPLDEFASLVPADARGRHHNMRGEPIDEHTADMYRLFDELQRHRPQAKTLGIGDGGNEIGMGAIPWEELHRRLEGEQAGRIPCRVPTDFTIIAGTSNWGAYALAAALLLMRDAVEALRDFDRDHQLYVLEQMVAHGPAVDGATGRREPTVDGLPFLTYIQPWEGIRRLLGLPS